MCESEVEAAMPKIIDSTAAPTSLQNSQSYVTFLFSEWHIRKFFMESTFERTVIKKPLIKDIDQKFQLPQFHFNSQGGFLAKYTFEIIIKKLIKIFLIKTFGLLPSISIGIFSITVDQSKLRFF